MMDKLVSVIVPVYRVEQYLEQCVRSVTCQSYSNMEIILVDDGSPDRSGAIADELAKEDARITVIHKKNGGLSSARNAGLDAAQGEFVMFVDSDDFWMDDTCLERLVDEMEKTPDCDFIGFNCKYYYAGEETYTPWVAYDESIVHESDKEALIVKLVQTGTMPMSACLKIIRRDFQLRNDITFPIGTISEDIPWFMEMLRKAKTFRFVNDYIYAYRQTSAGSITHSFSLKHFDDLLNIVRNEISRVKDSAFSQPTKDALLSFLAYEWCILLGGVGKIEDKTVRAARREELKQLRWLLQYTANPKVAKVAKLHKAAGFKFTELVLKCYLDNRKNA